MAEVTNELMFEVLKKIQARQEGTEQMIVELLAGQNAMRGYLASTQTDLSNIYAILARQDQRLDRIKRRLELRELAEPQHPFEPHP